MGAPFEPSVSFPNTSRKSLLHMPTNLSPSQDLNKSINSLPSWNPLHSTSGTSATYSSLTQSPINPTGHRKASHTLQIPPPPRAFSRLPPPLSNPSPLFPPTLQQTPSQYHGSSDSLFPTCASSPCRGSTLFLPCPANSRASPISIYMAIVIHMVYSS
jgi:hypothetical protein